MINRNLKGPRTAVLFLILELGLLTLVSLLSNFKIKVEGNVVNFQIANMSTPFGLLQNLVFGSNPELHRFYFHESERAGIWESPALAVAVFATLALAGIYMWLQRRTRP